MIMIAMIQLEGGFHFDQEIVATKKLDHKLNRNRLVEKLQG